MAAAGPFLAILALSLASASAANLLRDEPLSWSWRPGAELSGAAYIEDLAGLDRLLGDPSVAVVDARDRRLFQLGSLPGALSLPAEEAEALAPALMAGLPEGAKILIYCSDPLCPLAERLAGTLAALGAKNLSIFRPGYDGWLASGRGQGQ